jgi:hypothetical protein
VRRRLSMAAAALGLMLVASACGASAVATPGAAPRRQPGTYAVAAKGGAAGWSAARQVPAVAGAGFAGRFLSCPAPGDCELFFSALAGQRPAQPGGFAITETDGRWGQPSRIPLEILAGASCVAVGDCVAAGSIRTSRAAVVVSEVHGVWGKPQPVPGLAAVGAASSRINALSCSADGWCAAAGYPWHSGRRHAQPFVVSEHDGTWGKAQLVRGVTSLAAGDGSISALSCDPDGWCVAGGTFVVTGQGGVWGRAHALGGVLSKHPGAISSLSCTTSGNCTGAGTYATGALGAGPVRPFVITDARGTWGPAMDVPGTVNASARYGATFITSLSCAAPGQCAVTGYFTTNSAYKYSLPPVVSFIASQVDGTWGAAIPVPGIGALHPGREVTLNSLSCGIPGNCAAGGGYTAGGRAHALLVTEVDGAWGRATPVPVLARLTTGSSEIDDVRCWSAIRCVAIGDYRTRPGLVNVHVFLTTWR